MSQAIVVEDLRKSYGSTTAVDGVSFTVAPGEFFGILGPNGAGKTTTLEILEGLRQADSGQVEILGLAPWPRHGGLMRRIGVQLQASAFFERLTAREQIQCFAALYGVSLRRANAMLEMVGLAEKADTRIEQLSGGQAQRLSIACALVHDPELVFLDEPTAALDPQGRRNLWDLLGSLRAEGRAVVLTTHHMDEAETLCDRVAIMDAGRILQLGAPRALVQEVDAPVRISVSSEALGTGTRELPGVQEVHDDGSSLTFVTREPAAALAALAERDALDGLQVKGATLEDVYLSLTGREYRA
jgi:ABC-2 type transport system ATP-binding protein